MSSNVPRDEVAHLVTTNDDFRLPEPALQPPGQENHQVEFVQSELHKDNIVLLNLLSKKRRGKKMLRRLTMFIIYKGLLSALFGAVAGFCIAGMFLLDVVFPPHDESDKYYVAWVVLHIVIVVGFIIGLVATGVPFVLSGMEIRAMAEVHGDVKRRLKHCENAMRSLKRPAKGCIVARRIKAAEAADDDMWRELEGRATDLTRLAIKFCC